MIETDVAIIGAGVAGCIASIALTPGHRVLLIDKQAEPADRIGENLPAVARRILRRLDLLDCFEKQAHLQSQGMKSYWGSEQPRFLDQIRNPDGFGWFLDRRRFEILLRRTASGRGARALCPDRIAFCRYEKKRWHLRTESGKTIGANFVIDAGGRQSPFARQLGIKRQQLDNLIACWTTLPDRGESRLGVISAVDDGWWYSAPIPDNKRIIAFQTDADLVEGATKKSIEGLRCQAQKCLPIAQLFAAADDAGEIQAAATPSIRSANSSRLETVAGEGWAALGDAAISLDPLSSQGMYNAMASAMQLVELLQANYDPAEEYTAQIEKIWRSYRHHQKVYYQQERRWQQTPFWKRRH